MTSRLRWLETADGPVVVAAWAPPRPSATGVLIVPSIGHEANLMQGGTVSLAAQLAAGGAHALVLQLAGTDQSFGSLRTVDLVEHWRASVRRGLAELHSLGVRSPIVVACRLGAALLDADLLGGETPVGGVALWSPTTSGRRLVRELRLLRAAGDYVAGEGDELNVGGFGFSTDLLESIAALRLTPAAFERVERVLVIDDDRRPCDPALLDVLAGGEVALDHRRVDDLSGWIDVDPDDAVSPIASISAIAGWILDHRSAVAPSRGGLGRLQRAGRRGARPPSPTTSARSSSRSGRRVWRRCSTAARTTDGPRCCSPPPPGPAGGSSSSLAVRPPAAGPCSGSISPAPDGATDRSTAGRRSPTTCAAPRM